ncbi:MAG TPA: hypothetical protein VE986_06755 [Hyphomicrobiales bacterium]|nr:hypothetical protein [Hyphomicrobiales bacterium]
MNFDRKSHIASKVEVLGKIKESLAAYFDSEERRIRQLLLRDLDKEDSAAVRRYAREILFDLRLKTAVQISREITLLHHTIERGQAAAGAIAKQGAVVAAERKRKSDHNRCSGTAIS